MSRSLDAGAAGVLAPRVDGAASAKAAVECVKFAPEGRRGLAGVRANRYGTQPLADFVRESNEQTIVVVQIETPGALDDVGSIAALPWRRRPVRRAERPHAGARDPGADRRPPYRDGGREDRLGRARQRAGGRNHARAPRTDPGARRSSGYRVFTTSDRTLLLESARGWRSALPPAR